MIYSADMGVAKVAGIKLDQATGELKIAFVIDNSTNAFQPLIGPKDTRVLVLSNFKRRVADEPLKLALFTANYTEQVTWRDTATGRIIAESDFFEPLTLGSLITPGFGGRVYFPTGKGSSSCRSGRSLRRRRASRQAGGGWNAGDEGEAPMRQPVE
jgi:hypothetical protein